MSLARRAAVAASRTKPVFSTVQLRAASTSSHEHHDEHHHHETDSTVYPPESFATGLWGKVLLGAAAGALVLKYAPEPDEGVYLTRWIAMYATPGKEWLAMNARHTVQQEEVAQQGVLLSDAKEPVMHRFRYPQAMDQASPFLKGVGMGVDVSGVVPKTGQDRVL